MNINIRTKIAKKKAFIGKAMTDEKKVGQNANKGVSMAGTKRSHYEI